MSTTTTNYKLVKPALGDSADITAMNPNWDKIDTELKGANNHLDNLEDNFIVENLIPYPYFHRTKTLNGVTFTDNGDGTITVNGTNSGDNDADFAIFRGDLTLKAGTYILSGSPSGSSVSTYFLQIADEDWSYSINSYGDKVINVSSDQLVNRVRIVVKPGVTVNSVKFKPMLEFGNIAHEYTRYTESRVGLREEIANAKDNLFPYPYAEKSKTLNGITFTDNGDGTILVNGTATAEATFYISQGLTLKPGVYSFSGCSNAECKIQIATSDWSFNRTDSGKGRTFVLETTKTFSQVRISVPTGVTVTNALFKPMLVEGDTIPTKHKVNIDPVRKTVAYSCGENTTVLDIVNAYNNKQIGIGERLSLGTYGNFRYSYGYGTLLRAVFDQTLNAYVVKILIWDDADSTVGILYGKSADGSMLLKDAEHHTLYYEGDVPVNNNILINSNFAHPVNQRGWTDGVWEINKYGIDRWKSENSYAEFKQLDDCIEIYNNSELAFNIKQLIEFPTKYAGKYLTLSVKFKSVNIPENSISKVGASIWCARDTVNHQVCGCVSNGTNDVFSASGLVPNDITHGLRVIVGIQPGATAQIEWVKLEIGDHATPYVPRLYAEELQLCQRYYWTNENNMADASNSAIIAHAKDATYGLMGFVFPVEMRTYPTVKITTLSSQSLVMERIEGAIAQNLSTKGIGYIYLLNGLTKGEMYYVRLTADAEL